MKTSPQPKDGSKNFRGENFPQLINMELRNGKLKGSVIPFDWLVPFCMEDVVGVFYD